MRILLVTHYYAPEQGAPQRRWDALVQRFVAAGHQVAVLAPPPHYPSGRLTDARPQHRPGAVARGRHGEPVHRVRFREYDGAVGARGRDQLVAATDSVRVGLQRFSGRHRPDVVVATVPAVPTLPAGLALARALRVPLILELRDAWPDLLRAREEWDEITAPDRAGLPRRLIGALGDRLPAVITELQRRADAVVTTTETFAKVLRGRGMRHVVVVRNGARLGGLPDVGAPPSAAELRVLYLGTVGRSQGLATAIRAARAAEEAGVPVRLRIVGDGAELPGLRALVRRLDAPVTFEPPVPRAQVAGLYRWAHTVLVSLRPWVPLQWTVPSKLYEALAVGRHITAALAGEAAGIVELTAAGDVVPPGDETALAALWVNLHADRTRLAVGHGGADWVRLHADLDNLAQTYLDLLAEIAYA